MTYSSLRFVRWETEAQQGRVVTVGVTVGNLPCCVHAPGPSPAAAWVSAARRPQGPAAFLFQVSHLFSVCQTAVTGMPCALFPRQEQLAEHGRRPESGSCAAQVPAWRKAPLCLLLVTRRGGCDRAGL